MLNSLLRGMSKADSTRRRNAVHNSTNMRVSLIASACIVHTHTTTSLLFYHVSTIKRNLQLTRLQQLAPGTAGRFNVKQVALRPARLVLGWVTVFGRIYHLCILTKSTWPYCLQGACVARVAGVKAGGR